MLQIYIIPLIYPQKLQKISFQPPKKQFFAKKESINV